MYIQYSGQFDEVYRHAPDATFVFNIVHHIIFFMIYLGLKPVLS